MTPFYTQTTSDIDTAEKRCAEVIKELGAAFDALGLGHYDVAADHLGYASEELLSAGYFVHQIAARVTKQKRS